MSQPDLVESQQREPGRKTYVKASFHAVLHFCSERKDLRMKAQNELERVNLCERESLAVILLLCFRRVCAVRVNGEKNFLYTHVGCVDAGVQRCDVAERRRNSSLREAGVSVLNVQV